MVNLFLTYIIGFQVAFCSTTDYIKLASINVGVPYNIMYKIAKIESGLNYNAKNRRSSARGLFQIIKRTERYLRKKYNIVGSIFNPYINSLMGAYLIKSSSRYFSNKNIKVTDLNLYLAHFFGNTGAYRFLSFKDNTIYCNVDTRTCKYNRFLKDKTVKEIKEYFKSKLNKVEIK